MSRLKDKLRRKRVSITSPTETGVEQTVTPRSELIGQLREKMQEITKQPGPHTTTAKKRESDLPGEVVETDVGSVLVVEKRFGRSYRHGRFSSSAYLRARDGLASLIKNDGIGSADPYGAVFLDTETTGLAGGTGTLPFLIGVGWFEKDESFIVKQFFCREPGEEAAQLALLTDRLATASCLVTFNGKAFDIPLINTRYVLHKMKNPGYALPHLDLLFVARRVFKRRLSSCSLINLESAVLGFVREGDIPGSAIPTAYREYLRGGPVDAMESVLSHNALDLVGLAALGARLSEMYLDPTTVEHAADHLGLARAAFESGESEQAISHVERAGASTSVADSRDAFAMAAKNAARSGDHERARDLWEKALEKAPDDPYVHLALAKYYEHKAKNLEQALHHAAFTGGAEGEDGMAHRIGRLNRKLNRS